MKGSDSTYSLVTLYTAMPCIDLMCTASDSLKHASSNFCSTPIIHIYENRHCHCHCQRRDTSLTITTTDNTTLYLFYLKTNSSAYAHDLIKNGSNSDISTGLHYLVRYCFLIISNYFHKPTFNNFQ